MNILLINSDLAKNRGDRAIASGLIDLIKQRYPGATITGLSEFAERDAAWFGINFLKMDAQSLKLSDFWQLLRAARRADLVLWGGGEILKDYTNKLALWYWVLKLWLVSLANPQVYGVFQGIGPTKAASSRRLIVLIVNRCQQFIVRDQESFDKLHAWGAKAGKVISSSDPAVLARPAAWSAPLRRTLQREFKINDAFLDNFICLGPRSWFHYQTGGLVPFKYKQKFAKLFGRKLTRETPQYREYRDRLVAIADDIIARRHMNILLIPMHMSESDSELCAYIAKHVTKPAAVRVLAKDVLSPAEVSATVGRAKAVVGFRLHSTIISTSNGVPSINIYYVDKGRVFFDQINQAHFALPIERVLDADFLQQFSTLLDELLDERARVQRKLASRIEELRRSVQEAFQAMSGPTITKNARRRVE